MKMRLAHAYESPEGARTENATRITQCDARFCTSRLSQKSEGVGLLGYCWSIVDSYTTAIEAEIEEHKEFLAALSGIFLFISFVFTCLWSDPPGSDTIGYVLVSILFGPAINGMLAASLEFGSGGKPLLLVDSLYILFTSLWTSLGAYYYWGNEWGLFSMGMLAVELMLARWLVRTAGRWSYEKRFGRWSFEKTLPEERFTGVEESSLGFEEKGMRYQE